MSYEVVLGIIGNSLSDILRTLAKRHNVDDSFIDPKAKDEFATTLEIAWKAFFKHIDKQTDLSSKAAETLFSKYVESSTRNDEISKLLDPGFEIFDKGIVVDEFEVFSKKSGIQLDRLMIEDAWDAFLKAFSFASRSAPVLRDFLRASYEAGSFRAISNIGDVLESIEMGVDLLISQESVLVDSIEAYAQELKTYKDWASQMDLAVTN